jgi:hypothetical protein
VRHVLPLNACLPTRTRDYFRREMAAFLWFMHPSVHKSCAREGVHGSRRARAREGASQIPQTRFYLHPWQPSVHKSRAKEGVHGSRRAVPGKVLPKSRRQDLTCIHGSRRASVGPKSRAREGVHGSRHARAREVASQIPQTRFNFPNHASMAAVRPCPQTVPPPRRPLRACSVSSQSMWIEWDWMGLKPKQVKPILIFFQSHPIHVFWQ